MSFLKTLKVLHLYLLDTELEYAVGGFVNYGNIVQFADQTSGFSLPPCRIHRCEQSGKLFSSLRSEIFEKARVKFANKEF